MHLQHTANREPHHSGGRQRSGNHLFPRTVCVWLHQPRPLRSAVAAREVRGEPFQTTRLHPFAANHFHCRHAHHGGQFADELRRGGAGRQNLGCGAQDLPAQLQGVLREALVCPIDCHQRHADSPLRPNRHLRSQPALPHTEDLLRHRNLRRPLGTDSAQLRVGDEGG